MESDEVRKEMTTAVVKHIEEAMTTVIVKYIEEAMVEDNKVDFNTSSLITFTTSRVKAINKMRDIFTIQSPSKHEYNMRQFLIQKLKSMLVSYTVDTFGNILVTKGNLGVGESYPCVVAHMDRVHAFISGYVVVKGTLKKSGEEILWSQRWDKTKKPKPDFVSCGGCGDDGGGIYVALEALEHIPVIKVVFTVQEEIGCLGARALDLEFFKDCGYLLQGDRRNAHDLILEYSNSDVVSKEFIEVCTPIFDHYEFKKASGSFTDVMILASKNINISVFNFSVGYYNAHGTQEYTVIDELIHSTEFALNLINYLGNVRYGHVYVPYVWKNDYTPYKASSKYGSYYGYDEDYYSDDYWNKKYPDIFPETKASVSPKCTCSNTHLFLNTIDPSCNICNPIVGKIESYCHCGQSLIERRYTYKCTSCVEIYIKTNSKK